MFLKFRGLLFFFEFIRGVIGCIVMGVLVLEVCLV